MLAWRGILGQRLFSQSDLQRMRALFSEFSHLSSLGFSDLHHAYFGLGGTTFDNTIRSIPRSLVDAMDRAGRTTLSWAAEQGHYSAVEQLLRSGADPNKMDTAGRTPLHYSVYSETDDCMRLLLAAKASVNSRDHHGATALMILVASCPSSHKTRIESLLECLVSSGAEINAANKMGWRPLHYAARWGTPTALSFLLASGADCNATSEEGTSVLHLAIRHNRHAVIRCLLQLPELDCSGQDEGGSTFLHKGALHGNLETLILLKSLPRHELDLEACNVKRRTAQAIAEWRRDDNVSWSSLNHHPPDTDPIKWYSAFENLVNSIREAKHQKEEQEHSIHPAVQTQSDDKCRKGAVEQAKNEEDDEDIWVDAAER